MPPRAALYGRLFRAIIALNGIATQTAAHRRKFEYVIYQLKKFYNFKFAQSEKDEISEEEKDVVLKIIDVLKKFSEILEKYKLDTWTFNVLDQSCNFCYNYIQDMFDEIESLCSVIYPEADQFFDSQSEDLIKYNTYDLKAIASSFSSYNVESQPDSKLISTLQTRITEISAKLAEQNSKIELTEQDFAPIPKQYSHFKVNIKDFVFQEEIGFGITGVVFKGINNRTNKLVAIKKFSLSSFNTARFQIYQREVSVFSRLAEIPHPCIVGFVGATAKSPFCIITDYMPNGSLYEDLTFKHRLDATQNTIATYDIARGMQYLHSNEIIHRDLKSLNILLDEDLKIKICDFGLSRNGAATETVKAQAVGTMQWMAPELLTNGKISSKIDVYAYGIMLAEILICDRPFNQFHDPNEMRKAIIEQQARPILPSRTPKKMKSLMEKCWAQDPQQRPTFSEIIELFETCEYFFDGCDIEKLRSHIEKCKANPIYVAADWLKAIENYSKKEMTFEQFVKMFEKSKMPMSVSESVFKIFKENLNSNSELLSIMINFLLRSPLFDDLVDIVRKFPVKTLQKDLIEKFLEKLPTKSPEQDTSILILACRQGFPEEAFLSSKTQKDLVLTMNVLYSIKEIRQEYIDRITEKVIVLLNRKDDEIIEISLKLALTLRICQRIPHDHYLYFVNSQRPSIRDLFLICASFCEDFEPRFLHYCGKMWRLETSQNVLLKGIRSYTSAAYVLNKIENAENLPVEFSAKFLYLAARNHESLRAKAKRISLSPHFSNASSEIQKLLSAL